MKKLLFLILLSTSLLFAEPLFDSNYPKGEILLETGSTFFSSKGEDFKVTPKGNSIRGEVTAIIPYEKGCLLELFNDNKTYKVYLEKGTVLYTTSYSLYIKHITDTPKKEVNELGLYPYYIELLDIKPNQIIIKYFLDESI